MHKELLITPTDAQLAPEQLKSDERPTPPEFLPQDVRCMEYPFGQCTSAVLILFHLSSLALC